jgi:osmoprotectant transport system ATP-binding protein
MSIQATLHKTIVLVTHDIEEAIRVGDVVALFRPHGTLAQVGPPERLLAAPADSYVAGFVGFDRGIRRLSFFPAAGLALDTGPLIDEGATVYEARSAGLEWRLVTSDGKPRGWVTAAGLAGATDGMLAGHVPAAEVGHTFTVGTDSLRAALDAAVLSPAGQAIGVDEEGRAMGLATFDQIRAAIQEASSAADDAADREPTGTGAPL